jgi:hypothetical protein
MIPRMIPIDPERFGVQKKSEWAVLVIACAHKKEDQAQGGEWTCQCRCCEWIRERRDAATDR